MSGSRFVYVTYIRTTPKKLWQALLAPEFTRQYWLGTWQDCDWKPGSDWKLMLPDGPPRGQRQGARNRTRAEARAVVAQRIRAGNAPEGFSRLTYELEQQGESVKLTVIHEMDKPQSKLIDGVSNGWPHVLSSLKSLLETGQPLVETRKWPEGM